MVIKNEKTMNAFPLLEVATGGVLQKKVLLNILQIPQENPCVGALF